MAEYGWLLVPVAVYNGANTEDPDTFAFETDDVAFGGSEVGGAWGFISVDAAPTFNDAKEHIRDGS